MSQQRASARDFEIEEEVTPSRGWVGRILYLAILVAVGGLIVGAIYLADTLSGGSETAQADGASVARTGGSVVSEEAAPKVGREAPDFVLRDLEGNQVRLGELRGRPVLVNFWATWCPPCRAEMPDLEAAYQRHQAEGLVVLGVDLRQQEKSDADVQRFVDTVGITFPVVLDASGRVFDRYRVIMLPTSYFIDREGVVADMSLGAMNERVIETKLAKIL